MSKRKYLVTVVETYKHTYLVKANSKSEAEDIVMRNSNGCDSCGHDFCGTDYVIRLPKKEDNLDLYDVCEDRWGEDKWTM